MTRRNILTVALLLTIFNCSGQSCSTEVVIKFLSSLFRDTFFISYDKTKFLSFNQSKIKDTDAPLLKTLLPNYCFYSVDFESSFYEYREVETAIALQLDTTSSSIIIHSPVFTKENKSFFQLFYGITVKDSLQKEELSKEIVAIFSSITYKGHVGKLINLKRNNTVSFELWHDDLSWRIYDFCFDKNRLIKIDINSGVKRDKMWNSYKRM